MCTCTHANDAPYYTANPTCPVSGHSSSVTSVAWNNDGTKLASGSSDKSVKVWSVGSAGKFKCECTLSGHRYRQKL
jgi:WD40 repeat protein